MIIPEAKGYSIWLMFEKNDEEFFQKLIDKFSSKLKSPKFLPHITLVAGLEGDKDILLEKFDAFSQFNSFVVKSKSANYSDEFYRSLYVEIEKDEMLKELFELANRIFNVKSDFEKFFPHISLLYSFEGENQKKKLITDCLKNYPDKIHITRIAFWKTKGIPDNWRMLKVFNLKNIVY